ncbi:serine O-acetyltransferase [Pseudofulvibacter geojedonensis]|uniref:Serine acetyltransferase n=1 Tax=Pseudofulvibacter geojedonensis TaxID=1123758 RepID=A0ABW3HYT9_9FLAO
MKKFKLDIEKYKKYSGNKPSLILIITTQGLWALFVYRISNGIYKSKIPSLIKKILLLMAVCFQKFIEIITGISLPYAATIGTRFYIAHHGHIIIHPKAIIGDNCNIAQGVTVGVSGRGDKRGVPVIGNNVFIAANAVIAGKITVANNSVIGANSLVVTDVKEGTTVVGVPAVAINNNNSEAYI